MSTGRRIGAAVLAAALAVPACGRSESRELPARPQVVDVAMREYRYVYEPPTGAGRVVFRFRNRGRLVHEAVMVFLEEGFPSIEEQLQGSERRVVPTFARLPRRRPGRSGAFAVDLAAGRYAFVCFVPDRDGIQHARKGMATEFRVS